ncbi:unnamed protein product [Notodromas monacha]|uniref:Uncharacterized protein n=1 Tax=Notodromas monacha TaxID=399045 RepID=A0A7R9BJK2_9CRUS|nr:unnamed protein product [Notodromas monacha]CAG0915164.1 unnamed protein product [Notodromas monacha]
MSRSATRLANLSSKTQQRSRSKPSFYGEKASRDTGPIIPHHEAIPESPGTRIPPLQSPNRFGFIGVRRSGYSPARSSSSSGDTVEHPQIICKRSMEPPVALAVLHEQNARDGPRPGKTKQHRPAIAPHTFPPPQPANGVRQHSFAVPRVPKAALRNGELIFISVSLSFLAVKVAW